MKTERRQKLEWLSRGRALRLHLIGLYAERQERLSRADYAGISYGGSGGGNGNATERKFDALAETEAEIAEVERELGRVEAEIRAAIEQIHTPICQTYLRMRFLAYKSERQIARETNYSFYYIDNVIRTKSIDAVRIVGNSG